MTDSKIKIVYFVSNSLKKDPRVIKQVNSSISSGNEVVFVGFRDVFYDKKFLDEIGCKYKLVDLGQSYVGQLRSVFKKVFRKYKHFIDPIIIMVKEKPDIIHCNDFDTLIQSYIVSKIIKCKLVYDAHEINAKNIGVGKFKAKRITFIEKYLSTKVDAFISVSNSAADYFEVKYDIQRPLVVTNCPVKYFEIDLEKAKGDTLEVVYQGLMCKGRGYEEFVESSEFLNKNVNYILRGYGPIEEELKSYISENSLEEKIQFKSPVEVSQMINAASRSDLGVVLTRPINDNFKFTVSNKIFEYIHAGIPVLLSDIPEHRLLNRIYNFGLILNDINAKEIAIVVNSLANDHELYAKLRQNAILASHTLTWQNEFGKVLSMYKTIMCN